MKEMTCKEWGKDWQKTSNKEHEEKHKVMGINKLDLRKVIELNRKLNETHEAVQMDMSVAQLSV